MVRLFRTFILAELALVLVIFAMTAAAADTTNTEEATMSKAQQLLEHADSIFNSRQYLESRPIYEQAVAAAEEAGDNSDKAEALAMIARTYMILGDKDTASVWLEKAKSAAEFDEPRGWARFLGVKGRLLREEGKSEEAEVIFENMYKYCTEHQLYDQAVDAAHMLAITGNLQTQMHWAEKGIKAAEAGGFTSWLGPLWNNLGATYEEQHQYYLALEAYIKAREYHNMHGTEAQKAIADWAVGHSFINIGDYSGAKEWLDPVLPIFERLNEGEFIGLTCRELGEIALAEKNYQKAHDLFVRAQQKLKEANMPEWDAAGYQAVLDRVALTEEKLK